MELGARRKSEGLPESEGARRKATEDLRLRSSTQVLRIFLIAEVISIVFRKEKLGLELRKRLLKESGSWLQGGRSWSLEHPDRRRVGRDRGMQSLSRG